jgi:hypothetical protein
MKKGLYAYFGLLDLTSIDSPGHSLYQLGLIDSLRENFNESKFDFFSYYPSKLVAETKFTDFPKSSIGMLFSKYFTEMISEYKVPLESILTRIREKKYSTLYLKARFRNLSTLSKKWKDAQDFEKIIEVAMSSGYTRENIVILDTDLSLSEDFRTKYSDNVTILIPSIDFPGVSNRFLSECVDLNVKEYSSRLKTSVFYGNIDTSKYKSGNSKSELLPAFLQWFDEFHHRQSTHFLVVCKESDFTFKSESTLHIPRNSRSAIFEALSKSLVMVNITKDKYNEKKFIPARIYEAMIFGMIPVSYRFEFLSKAFSFETVDDLSEIIKYLNECSTEELIQAYLHFISEYKKSLVS